MSDVNPNYELERQELELQKYQLEFNIKSQNFRIAQILDEKARIETNIEATKEAIGELEAKINNIKEK